MAGSEAVAALLAANVALLAAGGAGRAPLPATMLPAALTTSLPLSVPANGAAGAVRLAPQVASGASASSGGAAVPNPDARADVARVMTTSSVTVRLNPSFSRAKAGVASWLDTIPAGTCANNDAPMGSTIRVTNGAGVSVTCKVVSTGPFVTGRVVDLAKSTFAQLGPLSKGLVGVAVSW